MLFNSVSFLIFFAIVIPSYFLMPHKIRWLHLLVSSYIFYMFWNPTFILLIIFSTFSDYVLSWGIYNAETQKRKKKLLITSLTINFSLLFLFKYSMFINETFMYMYVEITQLLFGRDPIQSQAMVDNFLMNYPLKDYSILLPMGISFYTFQVVGYVIDVYRGTTKPIKHYGIFSLYITFFPQLVAGPIERSKDLIPQFYEEHNFDKERVLYGIKIMIYGFFKKVVIADRISIIVNTIYNSPYNYTGAYLIVATLLFIVQVYCDFSGYSDIAVGTAKILGFNLRENFKNPFFSQSTKEIWKRWHISLSSWFTDYLYIPMGGSLVSPLKHNINLFTTFMVSGMWHGANWTFLIWGAINGGLLVIENFTHKHWKTFYAKYNAENNILIKNFRITKTFLLFAFSFIFFRGNNINECIYIVTHMFKDLDLLFTSNKYLYDLLLGFGVSLYEMQILFIAILFLFVSEAFCKDKMVYAEVEKMQYPFRLAYYVVLVTFILMAGVFYASSEFVYFQF